MDLRLNSLMRPKKGFPTGIPTANARTHFVRDAEARKVVSEISARDCFDVEHGVCSLRMTPEEARSYAKVLVDMADMAERA